MTNHMQAEPGAVSKPGAILRPFVLKDLLGLAQNPSELKWEPFHPGVDVYWIYREGEHGPAAALLRFQPGGRVPLHAHPGFEHIFILSGSQTDENVDLQRGSLMVNPPGTRHSILSEEGCLVLAIYEKRADFVPTVPPGTP